jgi:Flp pilus assembly protein TadG
MIRHRLQPSRRRAATIVECAIIFPTFFLLLIGFIVAGLGVFRYQEVASLAREGARWASVHGLQYQQRTKNPAATPADVYENAIKPNVVALDASRLTYAVTWSPDNRQGGLVTVRVTYNWLPEAYFGSIQLSSTSTMAVAY